MNYYVHWNCNGEAGLSKDQREAIRNANFETYNLITIFASSAEIAEILRIVLMEERELQGFLAHSSITSRYVYYIVGSVSAGKSTTLRHLRDLATVEEWPNRMPVEMNKQSVGLERMVEEKIDVGLEEAVWRKNCEIEDIKVGLIAVDRGPLDFIAFPSEERETMGAIARRRARTVLARLEENGLRDLCPGQVILLQAAPSVLTYRQLQRGGRTTPDQVADGSAEKYLKRQRETLAKIYREAIDRGSAVRTDRYPVALSMRAVARIIHLDDYAPFDFVGRLRAIQRRS